MLTLLALAPCQLRLFEALLLLDLALHDLLSGEVLERIRLRCHDLGGLGRRLLADHLEVGQQTVVPLVLPRRDARGVGQGPHLILRVAVEALGLGVDGELLVLGIRSLLRITNRDHDGGEHADESALQSAVQLVPHDLPVDTDLVAGRDLEDALDIAHTELETVGEVRAHIERHVESRSHDLRAIALVVDLVQENLASGHSVLVVEAHHLEGPLCAIHDVVRHLLAELSRVEALLVPDLFDSPGHGLERREHAVRLGDREAPELRESLEIENILLGRAGDPLGQNADVGELEVARDDVGRNRDRRDRSGAGHAHVKLLDALSASF